MVWSVNTKPVNVTIRENSDTETRAGTNQTNLTFIVSPPRPTTAVIVNSTPDYNTSTSKLNSKSPPKTGVAALIALSLTISMTALMYLIYKYRPYCSVPYRRMF
ncbi:B118 [miniopterid betaherpesvirus 1]|uniref:B118 n=1 Tax=miniopterid betaherpesvirus 1 TaxID=3070189 RepID=I3VQA8_9BETA|nr:B118 [miniopterid betaherpesvirus 1]AFK83952.1 B118 [miniopterid betaherpesvirus 1]